MIDKNLEPYYDILISIFLGVMVMLIMYNMYECPRIVIIEEKEKFTNELHALYKERRCNNLNLL